jgi:hypothetical protein
MMRNQLKPIDCVTYGFKKAFNELLYVNCGGCWCTGTLEVNYLLSLDIRTVWDNLYLLKHSLLEK